MLVLAIDASGSTANGDFETQIVGHVQALQSTQGMKTIRAGALKRSGVSAIVWSDDPQQTRCVPWSVIADKADAARVAERLRHRCKILGGTTAIGGAIRNATNQFAWSRLESDRWVIDISANEPANEGYIAPYRQTALNRGIVINGLLLEPLDDKTESGKRFDSLMRYFRKNVIGGPRSFVLTASRDAYAKALIKKLVREISRDREGV
jgi:hypothetical protein